MKLLFIAEKCDNHAGGGEVSLQTFFKLFIEDGNCCRLIAKGEKRSRKLIKKGRLQIIKIQRKFLIKELYAQIRDFKPDIIGGQLDWGEEVFGEIRNIDIPKIFLIKLVNFLEEGFPKDMFKLFPIDIVFAGSKYVQAIFWESFKKSSILSYPLINLSKYKVKKNSRRYITMINYRQPKGKEIFKKIAQLLPSKKFLAIRGWIPVEDKAYPAHKEGNITISGPYKDIREVYSKTKLLLVPSICKETFGRVALEAAVNGIPVIASKIGGLPEAVGGGGLLINNYLDEKVWVKKISKFEDTKYYQKMSRLALERAQEYDLFKEYKVMVEAMESLLEERKKLLVKIKVKIKYLLLRAYRFFYFKCRQINKHLGVDLKLFSSIRPCIKRF